MNDYRVPLRWAAIVTAAVSVVSAILAVSTAAQAAHPIRIQPFAADSGDACRYGTTSGSLAFSLNPWTGLVHCVQTAA